MKNYVLFTTLLTISLLYLFSSCADKLPNFIPVDCSVTKVTYVGNVKGILDAQCNIPDCHDNNNQSAFGNYSTLDQARMESIYDQVYVKRLMPPAGMDFQRIDSIRCWSESGYLEN